MELRVKAPYEPFNIEIADHEVKCRIRVTPIGLLQIDNACREFEQMFKMLQKLPDEAQQTKNSAKMKKGDMHIADAVQPANKAGIVCQSYDASSTIAELMAL